MLLASSAPSSIYAPAILDTLVDDAAASRPANPAVLRKGLARLNYIREQLGASTPVIALSSREIRSEVQSVTTRTGTDDSILDEDVAGVEAEVAAAFDREVGHNEPESKSLLSTAERVRLSKDLARYRADCRKRHLPSSLVGSGRVLAAV